MDTERAEGIVLRRQPVTESSLIVTWYTREFGKLKTMAKGARRPRGPFQGKIDLFYRDEIVFLPSRRSDLHLLHDCFLEDPHASLRQSVASLAAASYACELVELATEREKRHDGVLLIWFEIRLLSAAGWEPKWEANTSVDRVLRSLAGKSLDGVGRVRLSATQLDAGRQAVWRFWDTQLGQTPRTRRFLQEKNEN